MTDDYATQIAELQARVIAADRARARAEAQHETATLLADRAGQRLKDEFGVDTPTAALALLDQMKTALERELTLLRDQLDALET